jgi:hypothetical protein
LNADRLTSSRTLFAIYDAMFAQGYRQFIAAHAALRKPRDLRALLRLSFRTFVEFALADPARHQLLFQRTIPGFEPSPESWALALEAYEGMVALLAEFGVTRQSDIDLITAVSTGLADQQISNDAGGERWLRLTNDAADMVAAGLVPKPRRSQPGGQR